MAHCQWQDQSMWVVAHSHTPQLSRSLFTARAAWSAEPTGTEAEDCEPADGGGDIKKLLIFAALRPVRSAPPLAWRTSFVFGGSE